MTPEIIALTITAASLGFGHTLLGPDHYLPFIAMGRARRWSLPKTALITFLCGLGHVMGSVALGAVGIAAGVAIARLKGFEGHRGDLAGWLMLGFGLAYLAWGIRRAIRNRPHAHVHSHSDHAEHVHSHSHDNEHVHVHSKGKTSITPWVLFTIFVFGPCEPLIPLLMWPAAQQSTLGLLLVVSVFAATTILTMLAVVMAAAWGIGFARFRKMERYGHALAGGTVLACGIAILVGF